jgi:hypothetical protein
MDNNLEEKYIEELKIMITDFCKENKITCPVFYDNITSQQLSMLYDYLRRQNR